MKRYLAVVLMLISIGILLVGGLLFYRLSTFNIDIEYQPERVVNIRTLYRGEFCSHVNELRISSVKEKMEIVKFKAKGPYSRLCGFTIHEGINSFNSEDLHDYEVQYPQNIPYSFRIGDTYVIGVEWGVLNQVRAFRFK